MVTGLGNQLAQLLRSIGAECGRILDLAVDTNLGPGDQPQPVGLLIGLARMLEVNQPHRRRSHLA